MKHIPKVGIHPAHLRKLILEVLPEDLATESAVEILMGTAAQESAMGHYLEQINGPAVGIFQMEPNTFNWLVREYQDKYPMIKERLCEEMKWDLKLAILMARLRYRIIHKPLPPANNIPELAAYWKQYYNTVLGAGTIEQFIVNYYNRVKGEHFEIT